MMAPRDEAERGDWNPEAELQALIDRADALLTPRQRRSLLIRRKMRAVGYVARRFPGYRTLSLMVWRVKRQGGLSGIWEPPFNIDKQNRDVYDKRLRWHHWGVLREGDRYRAYTPTKCTDELYETPRQAWLVLEGVYWGRGSSVVRWLPLPSAAKPRRKRSWP